MYIYIFQVVQWRVYVTSLRALSKADHDNTANFFPYKVGQANFA
jgi:hypothetical protein